MRFNVVINQERCIKNNLNVSQAALMSLFNELSSWATERVFDGKTYWHISRNKVIEELPVFYEKSDTVYRHFRILAEQKMIEYMTENRKDYVRLTAKGKLWNKLGNESEFQPNSEMNPSKLGNESEFQNEGLSVENKGVIKPNSEMNPTDNYYNYTIHEREEKALAFLEANSPSLFEVFSMRFRSKFTDLEFESFREKFDATVSTEVDQRKLEFVPKQINNRLTKYVLNYVENMQKQEVQVVKLNPEQNQTKPISCF